MSTIWPIQCSAPGESDSGLPSRSKTMTPGPTGPGAVTSSARRNPSAIGSDSDAMQRTSSSVNHFWSASLSSPAAAQ